MMAKIATSNTNMEEAMIFLQEGFTHVVIRDIRNGSKNTPRTKTIN